MARVNWSHLPVTLADGNLLPHLSARMRTETIDAVFHNMGGALRLQSWAEANNQNQTEFYRMWARGAVRSSNVEVSNNTDQIEDLLEQLDRGEHAKIVSPEQPGVEIIPPEREDE